MQPASGSRPTMSVNVPPRSIQKSHFALIFLSLLGMDNRQPAAYTYIEKFSMFYR